MKSIFKKTLITVLGLMAVFLILVLIVASRDKNTHQLTADNTATKPGIKIIHSHPNNLIDFMNLVY